MRAFAGKLGTSPQTLADALELTSRLDKELSRLYVYASMLADEDTRLSEPQGMQQEMQQLYAEFSAQASYIEPEILRIGGATIEEFIAAEPRLAPHAFYLRDVVRRAAHTLTDAEEKILADAQPLAGSASNIYGILSNADFPYPTITLSDGRQVKVDQAGLRRAAHAAEPRRSRAGDVDVLHGARRLQPHVRHDDELERAEGAVLREGAEVRLDARSRRSTAPTSRSSVYTRLIDGVQRHLPTFHRYLRLRKRMLGITDDLHYYDLYAPLVASVNLRYTPEEAQQHVVDRDASARHATTCRCCERAFSERWLDWYPAEGKRSGAYSNGGAYDVHPYMLLNYLGQYNDVSTLAHELGHTMHSYYSNKTQPYATADYSTFVAEVASTFNEALLIDYMLKQIKDEPTRLSLLGSYLENIKATVFRQTQFAEFELRMHEMGLNGGADHRRRARRRSTSTSPRATTATTRSVVDRRRLRRERVELHPALLPRLLRLPVRHLVHRRRGAGRAGAGRRRRRDRALPDVPELGRLEVPDRSAEGRRRRHDDRRAARSDDGDDEPGDGRDGGDTWR